MQQTPTSKKHEFNFFSSSWSENNFYKIPEHFFRKDFVFFSLILLLEYSIVGDSTFLTEALKLAAFDRHRSSIFLKIIQIC